MDGKYGQNGTYCAGKDFSNPNQDLKSGLSKSASCYTNKAKETIVSIENSSKKCYFTRLQVGIFCLSFILTIVLVVLLLVFVGNNNSRRSSPNLDYAEKCHCPHDHVTLEAHVQEDVPLAASTGESLQSSDAPTTGVRLPRDLEPIHYDLELSVSLKNNSFRGNVQMHVYARKSTRYVIFHIKPFYLHILKSDVSVTLLTETNESNGLYDIVRQFEDYEKEIYVLELKHKLSAGYNYSININTFTGHIFGDLKGLYLSSYKNASGDKRYLAASQLQSTDARKVFPCFDEPDMKATFSVTITHSTEYVALGNMPVEKETCLDECSYKTVRFQTTPRMSTYLLAFVISDFKYTEKILPGEYALRIWSQPDMVNQTLYALDFATKAYEYFTDFFQIPDVVPKADHVAVPDFSGGAMENWGLVIYRETALLYDPDVSSSSNKFMVTLIVAHEIAHTWFGNMVTMKWWDDLWLNEGFASTLMYFAMDHVNPDWRVLDIVVVEDIFPVMVKDGLVTSHPVSPKLNHPDEIAESFDQISYNKGMAVLRMLYGFLGTDAFRVGLQMYVRKYMFVNAEMSELWQTFSEASNQSYNIGEIMDTWTRQMGYPVIDVIPEGGYYRLEQSRFLYNNNVTETDDSPYGYKWYVPFTYRMQDEEQTNIHWLNMGPGKIPRTSDGWILGNVNYEGFYRVNYKPDMWMKLADQLNDEHTVIPGANRAGLIGDAFNLARASLLDYAVALNMTTYMHSEESYVPWKAFLDALEFIRGMLSKQSAYVLLEKYIREQVAPVFSKVGTDDRGTLPEMYLRRMLLRTGCDVGVKAAIKFAKDRFAEWMLNGTRLPTDFSQVIYSVGIREGSVEEWDHVWTKSQESNVPAEREMMLEALAQTQKPWLLWRYANWIFDVNKIKMQDVRLVMSYFSNSPLGRMIALHFLMNRWDDLNEKFGEDTFIIREMIGEVTAYVNTDFELRQLELLFTEKPPKGARKGADNALALIRANINWMKMNYDSIADWLDSHVESSF